MPSDLDIPYEAPHVLKDIHSTHARFQVEPAHDPTLAFDLALPRAWGQSAQFGPVADGVLQERGLCFFTASLERGAPIVAVTATPVPFELAIDAWLRSAFAREGWRVVSGRWFAGPNGLFYDLTGLRTRGDQVFVRRSSARADGARIICVNSMCSRERWDTIKEDFWTAHATFALATPSGGSQMEPWLRARTRGLMFETAYPLSWSSELAEPATQDNSGIHIRLADPAQDKLFAYILVRAQRRPHFETESLATWLDDALGMLGRSGLEQTSGPRRLGEDEDPRSIGVDGWRGGYTGEGRVAEADLVWRLGFVERNGIVFTIALYAPRESDDLLSALRGRRAFEIARGGIELVS